MLFVRLKIINVSNDISSMSIEDRIKKLTWEYKEGKIVRVFEFSSFRDAIDFVYEITDEVEDKKNYPLISINGYRVSITLPREKQVTEKDLELAGAIDKIYEYREGYLDEEESKLLEMEDAKEKARHRSRGPYRKSSTRLV